MYIWRTLRRGIPLVLGGAAVAVGLSVYSDPAAAQETIACVSRLGLMRIVDDESRCTRWETARLLDGGGGGVKLVFVTSQTYTGDIAPSDCPVGTTGIACARLECDRLAAAANLPGAYEPWLSSSTSNVVDRLEALGADGPWFNVKGELVAASLLGLLTDKSSNYLYNPITYTELGGTTGEGSWTGTAEDGSTTADLCQDWTSNSGGDFGTDGFATSSGFDWTNDGEPACSASDHHLYCFQR